MGYFLDQVMSLLSIKSWSNCHLILTENKLFKPIDKLYNFVMNIQYTRYILQEAYELGKYGPFMRLLVWSPVDRDWLRPLRLLTPPPPACFHPYYHTSTTTYFWRLSDRLLNLAKSNWCYDKPFSSLPLGPSSWEPLSTIFGPAC